MRSLSTIPIVMLSLAAAGAPTSQAVVIEAYELTVNQPSSLLTYSFSTANPFTGTMAGSPGDATAMPPILPVRLKQATALGTNLPGCVIVSGCGSIATNVNNILSISGSLTSNAATTSTPVRPSGSYILGILPMTSSSFARNLSLNLVSSGPISATANLNNLVYPPFCAARGTTSTAAVCTAPYCGAISFTLGTVNVTGLTAVQQGEATGTLTPGANGALNFNISMNVLVTTTATLNGSPVVIDPQVVPATLTGTITLQPNGTASATSTLAFSQHQNTTPNPPAPGPATPLMLPADSPICADLDVVFTLTVTSSTVDTTNSASLVSSGPRLTCKCDTDNSGVLSIDDIFIYINRWLSGDPTTDMNGGGVTIDDLFIFLNCWLSPAFPC